MKIVQKIISCISLVALLFTGGIVLTSQPAFAQTSTKEEVCTSIGSGPDCTANKGGDLTSIIKTVINILSVMVGIVAVIMIIFAGFKYITSGGDTNKITSSKNSLIYALIGLVIVALAQFIVRYVLATATKATT